MNFKNPIYHCVQCKKIVLGLGELLFIEESFPRGFCSEECIEKYFSLIVSYYQKVEAGLRVELGLEQEDYLSLIQDQRLLNHTLKTPSEIWKLKNSLGEEIFSFIGEYRDQDAKSYYHVVLCQVFSKRPSFIYLVTASYEKKLIDEFRIGEKQEDVSLVISTNPMIKEDELLPVGEELLYTLEQKKSVFLANLLRERKDDDIPYEEFHDYNHLMENTLSSPDEIYSYQDQDSDTVLTYVKGHEAKDQGPIFYFVLCLKTISSVSEEILPILGFPTRSGELANKYRKGKLVLGSSKN